VKALADAGLVRIERRPVAPEAAVVRGRSAAPQTPRPSRSTRRNGTPSRRSGGVGRGVRDVRSPRRHGLRKDGGLPARHRGGARRGARRARPRPEIALTPQLAARFRARFGDDVAVLHSALPPGGAPRRVAEVRAGEVGIAVGRALGRLRARAGPGRRRRRRGARLLVQAGGGRALPRPRSRRRARPAAGAIAILGSATPSLETAHNAARGRFTSLPLPGRATRRPLPAVENRRSAATPARSRKMMYERSEKYLGV